MFEVKLSDQQIADALADYVIKHDLAPPGQSVFTVDFQMKLVGAAVSTQKTPAVSTQKTPAVRAKVGG